MQTRKILFLFICLPALLACPKQNGNDPVAQQTPKFGARVDLGVVADDRIKEASGIVASVKNKDVLWTHNDNGDKNRIFAIDTKGKKLGAFTLFGAIARDWEDIAIGPGPEDGETYLYVGDIGDNLTQYSINSIYRVPEPVIDWNLVPQDQTLGDVKVIRFTYPDRQYNAEALLIDPVAKDIYVITKMANGARVYRAAYPQSTADVITLEFVTTLPEEGIVAGDISRAGDEIILKNYEQIFYRKRESGKSVSASFKNRSATLPYIREPQGEAICWQPDGAGYFTISESINKQPVHLYYYPRLAN